MNPISKLQRWVDGRIEAALDRRLPAEEEATPGPRFPSCVKLIDAGAAVDVTAMSGNLWETYDERGRHRSTEGFRLGRVLVSAAAAEAAR